MFKLFCFVLTLGLTDCAKHEAKDTETPLLEQVKAKAELYLSLSKDELDQDGWIEADKCDALLHSGLASASGQVKYKDLFKARADDGQWFRRPSKDCLLKGESKSTTSRDMLLGLAFAITVADDLETISELIKYGEDHEWVFGQSDGSVDGENRIRSTPSFTSFLYQVRHKLGGKYHSAEEVPQAYFPHDGFEAHLQALTILVRGLIHGEINQVELNTIKSQVDKDKNNALFWAIKNKFDPDTKGNQDEAAKILLRTDLFPADRLPNSADRCIGYLWMHGEKSKDWGPCDPKVNHNGHDFLLVSWLLLTDSVGLKIWTN